jgi:serine/threonine-protein kinase RsbW
MPTDVRLIERVVTLVSRQAEKMDFSADVCAFNLRVALAEALSNAMLRGNGDDCRKHVRVRAWVDDQRMVVDVVDEGAGFDLDRCTRDPTTPENVVREDGRGLFLMRQLMDRVERLPVANRGGGGGAGNVVRLTLRRR